MYSLEGVWTETEEETVDVRQEEATMQHSEIADTRSRGGDTQRWMLGLPYVLQSTVKLEGLIPVYVMAPSGW